MMLHTHSVHSVLAYVMHGEVRDVSNININYLFTSALYARFHPERMLRSRSFTCREAPSALSLPSEAAHAQRIREIARRVACAAAAPSPWCASHRDSRVPRRRAPASYAGAFAHESRACARPWQTSARSNEHAQRAVVGWGPLA